MITLEGGSPFHSRCLALPGIAKHDIAYGIIDPYVSVYHFKVENFNAFSILLISVRPARFSYCVC